MGGFFLSSIESDHLFRSFSPSVCKKWFPKFKFIQKTVFTANETLWERMMPAIKVVAALMKRATNETTFFDLALFNEMVQEVKIWNLSLPKEFDTF